MRVLVVEDEADLRDAVVEYLTLKGLDAVAVGDGLALRDCVRERPPAVVVLDLALPGEDGLSLCRWLRRETEAGIIMATGAGQPLDRVVGLEIGADDYLVKPYDLRELLARIRSVSRRVERAPAPVQPAAPAAAVPPRQPAGDDMLAVGPHRLDRKAGRLIDPSGVEIRLTALEFTLARIFAERPNRVLSRALLGELAHGRTLAPDDRSIDISITRLRKKLESNASRPEIIRTVRGEGYQLDADAG